MRDIIRIGAGQQIDIINILESTIKWAYRIQKGRRGQSSDQRIKRFQQQLLKVEFHKSCTLCPCGIMVWHQIKWAVFKHRQTTSPSQISQTLLLNGAFFGLECRRLEASLMFEYL